MRLKAYSNTELTIEGKPEEIQALQAMLAGAAWVARPGEQLISVSYFKAPPEPVDDPLIPPKWTQPDRRLAPIPDICALEPDEGWHSPSYMMKHLCGYNYTVENYRAQVLKLQDWGFEVLRSRRGPDGKFWEVWYLPGVWSAQGELKDEFAAWKQRRLLTPKNQGGVGQIHWKEESDFVVHWLCRHASFGQLDVVVQRAAMTMD